MLTMGPCYPFYKKTKFPIRLESSQYLRSLLNQMVEKRRMNEQRTSEMDGLYIVFCKPLGSFLGEEGMIQAIQVSRKDWGTWRTHKPAPSIEN